ncbi:peptide IlvX [Silvania hatchlandensis]
MMADSIKFCFYRFTTGN